MRQRHLCWLFSRRVRILYERGIFSAGWHSSLPSGKFRRQKIPLNFATEMSLPGEGIGDVNAYYTCPYNKAHVIMGYKMHKHLLKCRAQYPKQDMRTCPYDAKHVVPEAEFEFHISMCPARKMLDIVKYNVDPAVDHLPTAKSIPTVESSEDWENEDAPAYKPLEQAAKQPHIIRRIRGATPSERRDFRSEQRLLHSTNKPDA